MGYLRQVSLSLVKEDIEGETLFVLFSEGSKKEKSSLLGASSSSSSSSSS